MANRTYEVMYIIDPTATNEKVAEINDAVSKLIEDQGGTIVKLEDIGRRSLAYPINKKTEGYYVLFEIEGSGQEILELERRMRVNDLVIRYVTVRVDEERKTADKIRAKRDNRSSKRAKFRQAEAEAAQASAGDES